MEKDKYSIIKRGFCGLKQAFTLLELLLIILIISVVLSTSLPLIRINVKNMEFKIFINKTYLFLDYAKVQAVLKNIIFSVRFNMKDNKIYLLAKGKNEDQKTLEINVPKNIYIRFDNEDLLFYPDGTFQEFKIDIFDKNKRNTIISSSGFDGKINVIKKAEDFAIL
ncbi:MAG: hypothetical protein KAS51_06455 [Candidatus Omnitrophica bacterium]|nr:hypothetical protein [Candidatus Omnitrophota bacterium]